MRAPGAGGRAGPLGLTHPIHGGAYSLGQWLILHFDAAPAEQNGAGADAAQLIIPQPLGNMIQAPLRLRAVFATAHHDELVIGRAAGEVLLPEQSADVAADRLGQIV